jgi:hypothetical protein
MIGGPRMARHDDLIRSFLIDIYDTDEKDVEYWKNKEKKGQKQGKRQ